MRLAFLTNQRSKSFRVRPELWRRIQAMFPRAPHYGVSTHDELAVAVDAIYQARCDAVVILGGDGTLRTTLTALIRQAGSRPIPSVVPLPGGTINLLCSSLRVSKNIPKLLKTLSRPAPSWQSRRLRPLCVEGHYGFVFGVGAFRSFIDRYEAVPHPHLPRALALLAQIWFMSLLGPRRLDRFLPRLHGTAVFPDREQTFSDVRAWSASVIADIGVGLKPYQVTSPQHFATLILRDPIWAVPGLVPRMLKGLPITHRCLEQGSATRLELCFDEPMLWEMDGDRFEAANPIRISLGPEVHFMWPK